MARVRSGGLGLHSLLLGHLISVLLACGNPGTPPTTVTSDSADQIFYGLRHHLTIEGVLRAHLEADTAYFYQASQRADLKRVHVTFFSPEGRAATCWRSPPTDGGSAPRCWRTIA
jgi:hypothetical protein